MYNINGLYTAKFIEEWKLYCKNNNTKKIILRNLYKVATNNINYWTSDCYIVLAGSRYYFNKQEVDNLEDVTNERLKGLIIEGSGYSEVTFNKGEILWFSWKNKHWQFVWCGWSVEIILSHFEKFKDSKR